MISIRFWKSNTCTKCVQVLPKLQDLTAQASVPLDVRNADDEPTTAQADGVRGFPTVLALVDKDVHRVLGPDLTMPQLRKLVSDAADGAL